MVQIVGCCHPKARTNSYVGPQLTKKRMQSEWKHLRGLPLLDNHNKDKKVGYILDAWVDGEQQLWIRAEIDESTSMGSITASRIRSGEYKGLSLGMSHAVREEKKSQNSTNTSLFNGGGGGGRKTNDDDDDESSNRYPGWESVKEVLWSNIDEVSVCKTGKWSGTILASHFSENPNIEVEEKLSCTTTSLLPLLKQDDLVLNCKSNTESGGGNISSSSSLPNRLFLNYTSENINKKLGTESNNSKSDHPYYYYNNKQRSESPPPRSPPPKSESLFVEAFQNNLSDILKMNDKQNSATTAAPIPEVTNNLNQNTSTTTNNAGTTPPKNDNQQPVPVVVPEHDLNNNNNNGGNNKEQQKNPSEQLAQLELEILQLRQNKISTTAEKAELENQLTKALHTVKVYSNAAMELQGTGDDKQLKKLAEESRSNRIKEIHGQAQDLLGLLHEWESHATTSDAKNALQSIDRSIRGFVSADKNIIGNETILQDTMGMTRVLHSAKMWGESIAEKERLKNTELQGRMTTTLTELQTERNSRIAVDKQLNTLKRQLDLLEHSTNSASDRQQMSNQNFSMAASPSLIRSQASASIKTDDSSGKADLPPQTKSNLFGSLFKEQERVGQKRTFASASTPALKQNTGNQQKRNKTYYNGNLPIIGHISGLHSQNEHTLAISSFTRGVSDILKTNGLNFNFCAGVDIDRANNNNLNNNNTIPAAAYNY